MSLPLRAPSLLLAPAWVVSAYHVAVCLGQETNETRDVRGKMQANPTMQRFPLPTQDCERPAIPVA